MSQTRGAVAVVGSGAVGSVLAAHLVRAGHETIVVDCGLRHEQIRELGLVITDKADIAVRPTMLLRNVADLAEYRDRIGLCFLCTKTWSLLGLLPELQKSLHPATTVVSFQNGIGPEDEVAKLVPREQVGRVVVNYGCGVESDGRVALHWFHAPNYLGAIGSETAVWEQYAGVLSRAGLSTQFVPTHEVRRRVFFKTILNSALNAMCASTGITMKQAMQYGHTRRLAELLVREGLSVGSAVGYNYGEEAQDECTAYLEAGGDHLPTMWGDLMNKTRTEIEYMNGKIVKIGQMFKNIDVDVNRFFTSMIVTLEIKSGARSRDDVPDYIAR